MNLGLLLETVILCLVGVISPGPNFFMAMANTLEHGRIAGIMTAIGITFGVAIWLFICGFGLAFVIIEYKTLAILLNLSASVFLFYIAYKIIKERKRNPQTKKNQKTDSKNLFDYFKYGFTGTVLNCGVGIFYSAIFAKIVTEYGANYEYIIFHDIVFLLIEIAWFIFIAIFVSFANKFVYKYSSKINLLLAIGMIYFGIQIAYDVIKINLL